MSEKPKKYVCCWSGGKDSTATIILCKEKNIPLDLIIFSEVMYEAKRNISGELPEQIDWIKKTAIPIFENWGYEVKICHAKGKRKDFLDIFFRRSNSEKYKGKFAGYLLAGMCEANSTLKVAPIKQVLSALKKDYDIVQYIGIAHNEPERLSRLTGNKISLLQKYGINESDTYDMCRKYNLLSPLYEYSKRGGCWFCPNVKTAQLANFAQQKQEIWQEFIHLTDGRLDMFVAPGKFSRKKTIWQVAEEVERFIEKQKTEPEQGKLF